MTLNIPSPAPPSTDVLFAYTSNVMIPEIVKYLLVMAGVVLVFAVWRGFRAQ
ncbi:hypothetical protein D3C72_387260 [compost metagenome]